LRAEAQTFQATVDGLMADGLATARGKRQWYPTTITAVVESGNATSHNRDSEIGYVKVPGAPSQPASNDDASVPAIVVASHE
jgi:hypothetical protein